MGKKRKQKVISVGEFRGILEGMPDGLCLFDSDGFHIVKVLTHANWIQLVGSDDENERPWPLRLVLSKIKKVNDALPVGVFYNGAFDNVMVTKVSELADGVYLEYTK